MFSSDGTKYVTFNAFNIEYPRTLDIFDFNRCTGELSNPQRMLLEGISSGYGLAISPNSQFLYVSLNGGFHQINLETIPLDTVTIGEYDGYTSPAPTIPFIGQLGPDGKIYFATYSTNNVLHVIHNPDESVVACNLEQHGIELPTYNSGTLPNHPNYRLGRLIGSPCDTLEWLPNDTTSLTTNPLQIKSFSVSPNPAISSIQFSTEGQIDYIITDWLGREIRFGETIFGDNQVDVSDLVSGAYFISLKGHISKVAKFVVQK